MLSTENDLRDALAPLRGVEPTDDQVARALQEASAPREGAARGVAHRRRRPALALVAATAVVVAVVAALPSGSGDAPGGGAILRAAAATAAEQPIAPVAALRYTSVVTTWTYRAGGPNGRGAELRYTQPQTRWLAADGTGLVRTAPATDLRRTGDRELLRQLPAALVPPAEERRIGTENAAPTGVGLPDDAAGARRFLDLRAERAYGRVIPEAQARWERTREILGLLGDSAIRPSQRAALFGVLAATEGVRDDGEQTDPLGRRGRAISLDLTERTVPSIGGRSISLPLGTIRAVVDPSDSRLLTWSFHYGGRDSNIGTPDQEQVYRRSGWVDRAGAVPPADPSKG